MNLMDLDEPDGPDAVDDVDARAKSVVAGDGRSIKPHYQ
jgi:hypothetical protein